MKKQGNPVLILGTGAIAKDIADLVAEDGVNHVAGFVVDQPPFVRGTQLVGKPIFWVDELEDIPKDYPILCGVAKMRKIQFIARVREMGFQFMHFIHSSSRVSETVTIGEGVVVNGGVQIAAGARLGDFVYINRGALIGHDTLIGAYSVISPGANIAGSVSIGESTYVGIGAIIIERVKIGSNCFIGAGSLVTQDVPDRVKVVGMPARIIERDIKEF